MRGAQAEFRFLTPALGPTPGSFGVQLDPYARRRRHAQLVGHLQQNVHFAQLLENYEDLMAEFLAHQRQPHELFVLVAVANDQVIGVLGEPENRLELRLAAALEADAGDLAELDDLFDDVTLLIDLDRIHGGVPALVAVLLSRFDELLVE